MTKSSDLERQDYREGFWSTVLPSFIGSWMLSGFVASTIAYNALGEAAFKDRISNLYSLEGPEIVGMMIAFAVTSVIAGAVVAPGYAKGTGFRWRSIAFLGAVATNGLLWYLLHTP